MSGGVAMHRLMLVMGRQRVSDGDAECGDHTNRYVEKGGQYRADARIKHEGFTYSEN
jgi:hypothetical protein